MNYFYLFLVAGTIIVLLIVIYDHQSKKKVNDILRANKNVPPLFMLRSAELKVTAIKTALNVSYYGDAEMERTREALSQHLEKITSGYASREIPLTAYYAKLGALLISANKFKAALADYAQVHA
jgi:hypothetical protein